MIIDDQSEAQHFLQHPPGLDGPALQQIETHISRVYIYADRVFKLKRAVKLPYLDFSTAQSRLSYCQKELTLNQRTAPNLYRSVHVITRQPDGSLALDGSGTLVDAIVEMARFEQDQLLDNLARHKALDRQSLDQLAHHIAEFHMSLPPLEGRSGSKALRMVQHSNEKGFADTALANNSTVTELLAECNRHIIRAAPLLDARSASGNLRRGHGDLHLRNICMIDGAPALFDCLEFDESLAEIDVLYDLAFLLMDLWRHDLPEAANQVFNRYLDVTGDTGALGLMPLFMALRATIRGLVAAAQLPAKGADGTAAQGLAGECESYIKLAGALLHNKPPQLVTIAGLSGSGKSTAAAMVALYIAIPPGARILSTDRLRKALFGVRPLDKLPPEAYTPAVSEQVYALQRQEARKTLSGGCSVIADGVFLRQDERVAMEDIARQAGVPFAGIWLQAPQEELLARVESRRNDPSDATTDIVHLQSDIPVDPTGWTLIDANQSMEKCASDIRRALKIAD